MKFLSAIWLLIAVTILVAGGIVALQAQFNTADTVITNESASYAPYNTFKDSSVTMFGLVVKLPYILIAILEWINIFDLKTNAILTLIVLTAFMINLTIYLLTIQN